ncbi:multiprotein-bridging factor 1c [Tanacetum coccineum]
MPTRPMGAMSQDWEPVVLHKSKPKSQTLRDSKSINQALRAGAQVETIKKHDGGTNKKGPGTAIYARKLDEAEEPAVIERVGAEVRQMIQKARIEKKMSQAELAKRINERPQVVQEYENGKAVPNQGVLAKMERVLGVKLRGKIHNATTGANMFHLYLKQDVAFLFDSRYYRKYEKKIVKEVFKSSANGHKDKDRVMQGVKWWKNIVLVKSFKEIEGKYVDYLSSLTSKRVVPVGPLVVDSIDLDSEQTNVIQWLDTKTTRSIIFVSLGSEYFLSKADMSQIALGLEMSNVNFI